MGEESKRVMLTGSWGRMMDNLIEHESGYRMEKCAPTQSDVKKMLYSFRPHAVVVCLSDDPREAIRMQLALEEDLKSTNIPVFALGLEEDCARFKQKVLIANVEVFPRPLDTIRLFSRLEQRIAQAENENTAQKDAPAHTGETAQVSDAELSYWFPAVETKSEPVVQAKDLRAAEAALKAEQKLIKQIERMTQLKGRKTILVVDDDVRMLNVIKLYLQDLYDITVVPGGRLALKFLSKKQADLVLLDYIMPDMDGPEVLREIRENSLCPNIPVLFLTGVSGKDLVLRGLEYRPSGYLLKPVTREVLLERVTEILLGLQ